MEYTLEIVIDDSALTPRLVIFTAQLTEEVRQLGEAIKAKAAGTTAARRRLLGYRDEDVIIMDPGEVFSFFTQGQTVHARTATETLRVRQRIYELEELLAGTDFVRISHSEIVNFNKVRSFEMTIGGTIGLRMTDGSYAYVSRRRAKAIKDYLGI